MNAVMRMLAVLLDFIADFIELCPDNKMAVTIIRKHAASLKRKC